MGHWIGKAAFLPVIEGKKDGKVEGREGRAKGI